MSNYFGIDTSNYTTSLAIFDSEENKIYQVKKLLPVKKGALGLRQSDAVFHHTKQLPELMEQLFSDKDKINFKVISASACPRNEDGSYMPCFLCGEGYARSLSAINKTKVITTSHQVGHILAALYSADKLELLKDKFIAFHVSGGTTDCLVCSPSDDKVIDVKQISSSLDLKGGQVVDRVGLMLGMSFPCGQELEKLALKSDAKFKIKPILKDGNCCLSGLENQCQKMLDKGEKVEDIAKYCLCFIGQTIINMTEYALKNQGELPVIYAGGVMSNSIIKNMIISRYKSYFAKPEFSCDNAVGVAIYGFLKEKGSAF